MPFTINRTRSLNIPVYHRIKSGGTNKTTEIKKIEGDARVLSELINTELKLEAKINPVTNHISIKVRPPTPTRHMYLFTNNPGPASDDD